jgi:CheY-like chemotaxis protein
MADHPTAQDDAGPDTVLVVDDQPKTRATICKMLRILGYQTLEAGDGSEAIHLFSANSSKIAAITLDLQMPTTNGRETLSMLSEYAPLMPIVISSGLVPGQEHLQGRIPGTPGIVYLQKPYTLDQLSAALKRVIAEMKQG